MGHLKPNQQNKYRVQWEASHGISDVRSIPVYMQIAKSNTCNFKCVYCTDHRVGNDIPRTKLEGAVWNDMLTLIPRAETLAFHGISEFMMDPDFFNILQRCAEAGVSLNINTNGSICTPKYLKALSEYPGFLAMVFSIDAATPETFLRLRGWNFNRVVRNIKTYVECFSGRRQNTLLSLSFVITQSNLKDMVPLVFLAKELNMDRVRYYWLHEYEGLNWEIDAKAGGRFNYRDELVSNLGEEYNREIALTAEAAEFLGIRAELPALLMGAELQEQVIEHPA